MNLLIVSPSPHIRGKLTTNGIMRDVLIALAPAAIASAVIFGLRALLVIAVCVVACVVFEFAFQKLAKHDKTTIGDLSAAVTGVLLAFNLPSTIPLWQAVVGCFFAIVVVKQLFGGIGKNFANPAVTARIFLALAFAATMSHFVSPVDGVTSATPLMLTGATPNTVAEQMPSMLNLFLGNHGGVLGETSALALLLGGTYLLIRRVIGFETPLTFIGVVFLLSLAFGRNPVQAILSGGVMLGAFFMATDYVTAPLTFKGRVIFGIGCGLFTVLFRELSSYPEGVSFAILLMNILTPYINRFSQTTPFGVSKRKKEA